MNQNKIHSPILKVCTIKNNLIIYKGMLFLRYMVYNYHYNISGNSYAKAETYKTY